MTDYIDYMSSSPMTDGEEIRAFFDEQAEEQRMTNKEAAEILKTKLNIAYFSSEDNEALDLAIKALEFQERFTDIVAQAVVNSGCDSLEEFCEKIGVHNKEVEND